jgi:hypothetical protein
MLSADDWIYLTHPDTSCYNLAPALFNTKTEAEEAMQMFRQQRRTPYVKVVEYDAG